MASPAYDGANSSDVFKVIEDSLMKGRKYSDEGNFGRSFAHYLVVLQLIPPYLRQEYEEEFTHVLSYWGNELYRRKEFQDMFRCYHIAAKYFPTNVEILNSLGAHALTSQSTVEYFSLECYNTAKQYFENAISFDPHYLPAEHHLQTLRYTMVERWHFPMLNDIVRNKSYAAAIFTEISHGFTRILDVGTGTGLLSMYASRSHQAQSITACDYSEPMFQIARKVLATNGITNIKLLNKNSTNLRIPGDLNHKVTLLVTEILDCGIFGENIINTLIHAWEHLLVPFPMGKIIPASVQIYIVGIRSEELSRKVRVENNILKINEIHLSHSNLPYDSENLRKVKVDYVTGSQMALMVDFNSVTKLKQLADHSYKNPVVKLKCLKNSAIDAFAIWFNLHLNESISLSNNPKGMEKTSWEQAISYLRHPLSVQQNEEIGIRLDCSKGYIEIKCSKAQANNTIMYNSNCFDIPKNAVLYLNDRLLMEALEKVAQKIWTPRLSNEIIQVLDTTPFPILGLLLAQKGAHLTVRIKDATMEYAIRHICQINNIAQENITLILATDFQEYTTVGRKFDIVFQNIISSHGLLSETELYQTQILSMCMNANGKILPQNVYVWAQIVDCKWLDSATKVDDTNVIGFKIAEHINDFKSTDHRDMNFDKIEHTALSEPVQLGHIRIDAMGCYTCDTRVQITADGTANAVFYWFEVELSPDISVSTRRPDAFVSNAVFMLNRPLHVNKSHVLCVTMKQHKGILKIYVEHNKIT